VALAWNLASFITCSPAVWTTRWPPIHWQRLIVTPRWQHSNDLRAHSTRACAPHDTQSVGPFPGEENKLLHCRLVLVFGTKWQSLWPIFRCQSFKFAATLQRDSVCAQCGWRQTDAQCFGRATLALHSASVRRAPVARSQRIGRGAKSSFSKAIRESVAHSCRASSAHCMQ